MKVTAVYDHAVPAPVQKGQVVGTLQITAPDVAPMQAPLVAAAPVAKVGRFAHAALAAAYLLFGRQH